MMDFNTCKPELKSCFVLDHFVSIEFTDIDPDDLFAVHSLPSSSEDLSFDGAFDLDQIDENDLFNLSSSSTQSYELDTPPETPDNYSSPSGGSYQGVCDSQNACNTNSFYNVDSNGRSNFGDEQTGLMHSPKIQTSILSPQSYCESQSSLSPPIQLSSQSLNGQVVFIDSISPAPSYSQTVRAISIQPKVISPNQTQSSKHKPHVVVPKKANSICAKVEARKLKNRESALNSRLKKQEYFQNLEKTNQALIKKNEELTKENLLLKQKVSELEWQVNNLKLLDVNGNYNHLSDSSNNNKKAKISFFAVMFIFFFQVSPYLLPIQSHNMKVPNDTSYLPSSDSFNNQITLPLNTFNPNHRKIGRSLLSYSSDYVPQSVENFGSEMYNGSSTEHYANSSILCNQYLNQSESIRLENQLRDFLTRFISKDESSHVLNNKVDPKVKPQVMDRTNRKKVLFDAKHVPIPRLKMWMQKHKYSDYLPDENSFDKQPKMVPEVDNGLLPLFNTKDLMAMFQRRDDTFYYLSYPSKGHLILPPISNRSDVRPRFSFLIPSLYNLSLDSLHRSNNSAPSSHINSSLVDSPQLFMLQIDCQVINTKVTVLKDTGGSTLPNKTTPLTRTGPKKLNRQPLHSSNKTLGR